MPARTVICEYCGVRNQPGSPDCQKCGEGLPATTTASVGHVTPPSPSSNHPYLSPPASHAHESVGTADPAVTATGTDQRPLGDEVYSPSVNLLRPQAGEQVAPLKPGRRRRTWTLGVGVLVAALSAAGSMWWNGHGVAETPAMPSPPSRHPTSDDSTTDDTGGTSEVLDAMSISDVVAESTAPPSIDGSKKVVTYEAAHLLDGDLATAWRTEGDASAQSITVYFTSPQRVTQVGLTNGYTKKDPENGIDRYQQERRITAVIWAFDGGITVDQMLDDGTRSVQERTIDPVVTSQVRLVIAAVTEPGPINDPDGPRDFTAISEIQIMGRDAS